MDLLARIEKYLTLPQDQQMGVGCYDSACALEDLYGGGEIRWVADAAIIGRPEDLIGHFYFIAPGARDSDLALNHADAGYGQYPELSVAEVRLMSPLE